MEFHSATASGSSQYKSAPVAEKQTSTRAAAARATLFVGLILQQSLAGFAAMPVPQLNEAAGRQYLL
jgi:hypothetical protein